MGYITSSGKRGRSSEPLRAKTYVAQSMQNLRMGLGCSLINFAMSSLPICLRHFAMGLPDVMDSGLGNAPATPAGMYLLAATYRWPKCVSLFMMFCLHILAHAYKRETPQLELAVG